MYKYSIGMDIYQGLGTAFGMHSKGLTVIQIPPPFLYAYSMKKIEIEVRVKVPETFPPWSVYAQRNHSAGNLSLFGKSNPCEGPFKSRF